MKKARLFFGLQWFRMGVRSFRDRLRAVHREAFEMDVIDLMTRLTLILLLFEPVGDWMVRPFVLLLAGTGLLLPNVARSVGVWLLLTLLTGWKVIADWPLADNHAYLLCYWCLAMTCSLMVKDVRTSIALNGRLLIGLAFAFATLWKLFLSPDYLDGTFFRVTMLTDNRFADLGVLLGGLNEEAFEDNRTFLEADFHAAQGYDAPGLVEPTRFTVLAQAATWWTVAMEAAVALCFLCPVRNWVSRQRHVALLLFCATTFAVAPVFGFGWLLIVMGVAQCEPEPKTVRSLYLATFGLILLYREIPWTFLLINWTRA